MIEIFIGAESLPSLGGWVTVDTDPEATQAAIEAVAETIIRPKLGPDAEYGVMDTDDYPGSSSDLAEIQLAVTVADQENVDIGAVVAYLQDGGTTSGDAWELGNEFREAYAGDWRSFEDYAQDLATETGMLDEGNALYPYVDWERFARDLSTDGYWTSDGGIGVHVFRPV